MNEKFAKGLVIGAIAAAALVLVGPSVSASARPLIRRGIKAAVKGFAESREAFAELKEIAEDAYAEAWAELKSEAASGPAAAAAGGSAATATASASAAGRTAASRPRRKPKTEAGVGTKSKRRRAA